MVAATAVTTVGVRLRSDARHVAAATGVGFDEALAAVHRLFEARMQMSAAQRIARERDPVDAFDLADHEQGVARLAAGEPLAYVVGEQPFREGVFVVTPDVLIPRPDTEVLVACALERLPARDELQVLDLGTGSGCIAISIALERPNAEVTAVDTSPAALEIARLNAQRLGAGNVRFVRSDWFEGLADRRFDVIVTNPPYIAATDPHLADLAHEPRAALVAGPDGLDAIRRIVADAADHLEPGGVLLVEHGYDQRAKVLELLRAAGLVEAYGLDDLAGRARVVVGRRPGPP
jgi:release factor glutamine methyltransferase